MDPRLNLWLNPVRRRLQIAWRWTWWTALWGALTLAAALFWLGNPEPSVRWGQVGWGLVLLAVTLSWGILVLSRRRYQQPSQLAGRIEQHYPSLEQRLVTAVTQQPEHAEARWNFLQQTLLRQTLAHAAVHDWSEVVSKRRLRGLRAGGLLTLALGITLTGFLLAWAPERGSVAKRGAGSLQPDVRVEPGDAEIERGTGLTITARFTDQHPSEVMLVWHDAAGVQQRQKMTANLEDPLFGWRLPQVQDDLQYHVDYDGQQVGPFRVQVFDYPRLTRADLQIEYPEYTALPPQQIEDTRQVTAVSGSRVTWELRFNKPLTSASLRAANGQPIPLEVDAQDPCRYRVTTVLQQDARWTVEVRDEQQRTSPDRATLVARVVPNRPAELKLDMARDTRVSPLEEFPARATVSDDYGVRRYGVSYWLGEGEPQQQVLGQQLAREEAKTAEYLFDLERMQAAPAQLLAYHFWAEDMGPDGQPRRIESDMFFAEVRPFEEIFRPGDSSAQQATPPGGMPGGGQGMDQLLEVQKEIIAATWNVRRRATESELSEELCQDLELLRETQQGLVHQILQGAATPGQASWDPVLRPMRQAVEQLRQAATRRAREPLEEALQAERLSYQALLQMQSQEHDVVRSQPGGAGGGGGGRSARFQQQLQQLQLQQDERRYETQRQAQQQADGRQQQLQQTIDKLKQLARRQQDLNQQLQDLQIALQAAEQAQREALQRQLKRLRDQQDQLLRDTDELLSQSRQSADEPAMRDAVRSMEQSRQQIQRSREALQQGEIGQSVASGTRAERDLQQASEQLRGQAASQFTEQMQRMRRQARELEQQQRKIGRALADRNQTDGTGLRGADARPRDKLVEQLQQQQEQLERLMQQMQTTVQQAQATEPLLAERLYEAYRQARQAQVDQHLDAARQFLRQHLDEQSQRLEQSARQGISQLRRDVDQAAESILGDETEALRLVVNELDDLARQLQEEMQRATAAADERTTDPAAGETSDGNEPAPSELAGAESDDPAQTGDQAETRRGSSGEPAEPTQQAQTSNPSGDPNRQANPPDGRSEARPRQRGDAGSSQESQPEQTASRAGPSQPAAGDSPRPEARSPSGAQGTSEGQTAAGGLRGTAASGGSGPEQPTEAMEQWVRQSTAAAPLTGDDFRRWFERLRQAEQLVEDPELRAEAARIRQQAGDLRREVRRHARQPQWPLVEELVIEPLQELRQQVAFELARRTAEKNGTVPLDRDPVPAQFAEQVRKYYERLSSNQLEGEAVK